MNIKLIPRLTIVVITVCIIASGFFLFLYHVDNKYTMRLSPAQDGTIILSDSSSGTGPDSGDIAWITDGWEFYPDVLLEPGEEDASAIPVYIGQFFSLSQFHADSSPYGESTYRINIYGHGDYVLMLPEIFCASRVYINGELSGSSGSVEPYHAQVRDLLIPLRLDGSAEIIVQTANHTHYYSGMTYPPAIGDPEAINNLIVLRMLFYGFLCFTSLALALFSSVVWFGMKKTASNENLWLGLFALSFALRVCYPFVRLFGIPVTEPLYALEDVSAAVGIFCVVRIASLLCIKTGSAFDRILAGITLGFIIITAVVPLFLLKLLPGFAPVYGQLVYWYKAIISLLMIVLLFIRCIREAEKQTPLLLTGLLFYAVSLTAHALCLGHYEPAHFGWFEEWGAYLLIIFFGVRMVVANITIVRENRYLNAHLQKEVERKTNALTTILEERRMLLSAFAHDLKTPITSITTFTRLVELDNTELDEESRQYLSTIRRKTRELQDQLNILNEFSRQDSPAHSFESLDLNKFIREFYDLNKPDIDAAGLDFQLSLPHGPHLFVYGDKKKLTSVLQNLVYNALSFTSVDGEIRISLHREDDLAVINVEDTGCGISADVLPHVFDQFFTRRENHDGQGLGLYITKSIVTEHGGAISAASEEGKGSVFTVTLPLCFLP